MTASWLRRPAIWCWAILLLAVAVRLYRLPAWDMWTDEVQTLWTSQTGEYHEGPMYRTAPVNFVLTGLAVRLWGANELGARLVPFLAGCATVALVYLFMRTWVGARAAVLAMLLLALSFWHVAWSQTARHFALQTLLVLIAMHGFCWFWFRGRTLGLVTAGLALLTALFVHSSSGFYLAALLGFVTGSWLVHGVRHGWFKDWESDRRHLTAAAALVLVLAVYLPIYLSVGQYLLANKAAWNPPWNIIGSLAFYVPPYLALLALGGVAFLMRAQDSLGFLLLCLMILPVLLVSVASLFTIASGAYVLASLPAVVVAAGVAGDRLLGAAQAEVRVPAAIAVSAVFAAQAYDLAYYFTFYHGLKPQWRAATSYVQEQRHATEWFLAAEGDVAQFYLGRDQADWVGKYQDSLRRPGFPPPGVTGVWYATYLTETPIARWEGNSLRQPTPGARLMALFPLHYGAKDRTIAVYHETFPAR